jgi:hypothetical protein
VKIEYEGLNERERTVQRSLPVSDERVRIRLRLDRRTRRAVREARGAGGSGGVPVAVNAIAVAPSGAKDTIARTVNVR